MGQWNLTIGAPTKFARLESAVVRIELRHSRPPQEESGEHENLDAMAGAIDDEFRNIFEPWDRRGMLDISYVSGHLSSVYMMETNLHRAMLLDPSVSVS